MNYHPQDPRIEMVRLKDLKKNPRKYFNLKIF